MSVKGMTINKKDAQSCICTINMLRNLAYNTTGTLDWIDHENCDKIIKMLETLIELPPHGRLIDATFEENHYASMLLDPTPDVTEQDKHNARIIIDALRMAGTVIEAEGSET